MNSLVQSFGVMGMGCSSIAIEMIADEQRLSTFANIVIGVSSSSINDLGSSELTNFLFRLISHQKRVMKLKNKSQKLHQKEARGTF